ncbi:MAG: glycosyltransferase, partial [Phycisphaerae bacterium]
RYGPPPPLDVDVRTFPAWPGRFGFSAAFRREADDLVRGADVVQLHGLWTHQNACAGRVARRSGKPYIMTPHSMMMPWAWRRSSWRKRPAGWLFEHRNLRRAAWLHALSEGEAGHIRALRFNERIEVIPNGIDLDEFTPPTGAPSSAPTERRRMLFVSRIHPQKGVEAMVRGCLPVLRDHPDWTLEIAGPDEVGLQRDLEDEVRRAGRERQVAFLGMLKRSDVLAAMHRAAFLIQPSLSEGLSVSILEAMAARLPVIISPECNLPEVADADAGRIVAPEAGAIESAVRELVGMSDMGRRAMGKTGRRVIAERFSWESLLPRYRDLYEQALATPAG